MAEIVLIASGSADAASVLARRYAAERATIGILGPNKIAVQNITRHVVRAGAPSVLAIPCDLLDTAQITAAAAQLEQLGPIERWINTTMSDYGFLCATRAALAIMQPRDRGTIVQVSPPRAIRGFTDALAAELRLDGSHLILQTVRTQPFRRAGAAAMAGAAILGAALLRRGGR